MKQNELSQLPDDERRFLQRLILSEAIEEVTIRLNRPLTLLETGKLAAGVLAKFGHEPADLLLETEKAKQRGEYNDWDKGVEEWCAEQIAKHEESSDGE